MIDLICIVVVLFLISKMFVMTSWKEQVNREQAKIDHRLTYSGRNGTHKWTESGEEVHWEGMTVCAKDGTILHDYRKEKRLAVEENARKCAIEGGRTFYRIFTVKATDRGYYAKNVNDDGIIYFCPYYRMGGKPCLTMVPEHIYPLIDKKVDQIDYSHPWDRIGNTYEYRPR